MYISVSIYTLNEDNYAFCTHTHTHKYQPRCIRIHATCLHTYINRYMRAHFVPVWICTPEEGGPALATTIRY